MGVGRMKLFSALLLNPFSIKPLPEEGNTGSRDVRELNIFSLMIGNRNRIGKGSAAQLVRVGNTILDFSKLTVATFEPDGAVKRLKLVFAGSPELTLEGKEAENVWLVLVSRVKA
jgi:hypothetical protein